MIASPETPIPLVDPPTTERQARTYAARVANARRRAAIAAAPHVKSECEALGAVAQALLELPLDARQRVLGFAKQYLTGS